MSNTGAFSLVKLTDFSDVGTKMSFKFDYGTDDVDLASSPVEELIKKLAACPVVMPAVAGRKVLPTLLQYALKLPSPSANTM